jgi:AcrR family transcriptional regulator
MQTKGERTRQALLDAAISRFGLDGFRGTSVAEIARDARLSGTAAYAYFPNKEALFVAAVDEDAAGVIAEGVASVLHDPDHRPWDGTLIFTLLEALDHHPLARRVLGGLEPDFTVRLLGIPALEQLRKASADMLRTHQLAGDVRHDIDADRIANGMVSIVLSMLMSLVQTGADPVVLLGDDVRAVIEAALRPEVGRPQQGSVSRPRRRS